MGCLDSGSREYQCPFGHNPHAATNAISFFWEGKPFRFWRMLSNIFLMLQKLDNCPLAASFFFLPPHRSHYFQKLSARSHAKERNRAETRLSRKSFAQDTLTAKDEAFGCVGREWNRLKNLSTIGWVLHKIPIDLLNRVKAVREGSPFSETQTLLDHPWLTAQEQMQPACINNWTLFSLKIRTIISYHFHHIFYSSVILRKSTESLFEQLRSVFSWIIGGDIWSRHYVHKAVIRKQYGL